MINKRHKVMHHRPIRLGVIKALRTKKEEIFALLDTAKSELSEKERIETSRDLQKAIEKAAQPSVDLQKAIEKAAQLPVDWQKAMEKAAQPSVDLQKAMEKFAQPSVNLTKMNDNPEVQEEENPKSDIDNSQDNSKH